MPEPQQHVARRRRRQPGWIPNYHGAWAMITIPPILGIIEGGFRPQHIALLALWWIGYFLFFAATLWLKSGFKARYQLPVVAYGVAALLSGVITAALCPYLWRWVPAFIPLIAAAGWAAYRRKERNLGAGLDTVAAACLLLPITWDLGTGGEAGWAATPQIWAQTALLFGYFAGTVFYVKTNIRERNSNAYLGASIGWHVAWTGVACAVAGVWHLVSWWHAPVWVFLVIRSVTVPMARRAEQSRRLGQRQRSTQTQAGARAKLNEQVTGTTESPLGSQSSEQAVPATSRAPGKRFGKALTVTQIGMLEVVTSIFVAVTLVI
ncbi:MAG: YwiC-like family protein [Ancrocorticia sp.]|uniref:YwiC-like family protein n=1 Tax=Ancrocorticia sp. TaxID=2593684 RepID=UPI003F8DA87E